MQQEKSRLKDFFLYCLSKKSGPHLWSKLHYELGQDFLNILCVKMNERDWNRIQPIEATRTNQPITSDFLVKKLLYEAFCL